MAGAVKSNKIKKTATSDWMDIEKQKNHIFVTYKGTFFDWEAGLGECFRRRLLTIRPPEIMIVCAGTGR